MWSWILLRIRGKKKKKTNTFLHNEVSVLLLYIYIYQYYWYDKETLRGGHNELRDCEDNKNSQGDHLENLPPGEKEWLLS